MKVSLIVGITTSLFHMTTDALILPPAQKINMGLGDELREECEGLGAGFSCHYELEVEKGYQIGQKLFNAMAESGDEPVRVFLPMFPNNGGELEQLADVMCMNWKVLGGVDVQVKHWPDVPASCLEVSWPFRTEDMQLYSRESDFEVEDAVKNTENYVDKTLAGLGLCPFTKSMSRSALGLEALGVQPGPVAIRHSAKISASPQTTPATVLAAMYWNGVAELLEKDETEAATFLLVAPETPYQDFEQFYKDCDNLIEKTNLLSPGSMGRVWFHPRYKLSEVGYQSGGHAPPMEEVEGLMDKYLDAHPGAERPSPEDMARAHDITRWTPHPTINLLRPKQLAMAKENDKRENRAKVYPRNVVRVLDAENKGELEEFLNVGSVGGGSAA